MSTIIDIQNLTITYNGRRAVDDVSLTVEKGDIFGFVGPNGAGKTSTIRVMATLLEPKVGDILVGGESVKTNPNAVKQMIGYMPDVFGVYNDMQVWEYLDFFGACYNLPENENYPTMKRLKNAKGTEQMPTPEKAAENISEKIVQLKEYESGAFIDARKM